MELKVDLMRSAVDGAPRENRTGIMVRAMWPDGKMGNADIHWLTKESLLVWRRSRGGENPWAENVVGILLGHGNLHE